MPKPLNLIELNGVVDESDYDYIVRFYSERTIVKAHPAPKKGDNINPNVSRFELDNGEVVDIVHVKPIYYADKNEKWRPMSEIAEEFGNHYIKLIPGWQAKVHRGYLRWIHKRMQIINANKPEFVTLKGGKTVPRGISEKVGLVHVCISDADLEIMWRNPNF